MGEVRGGELGDGRIGLTNSALTDFSVEVDISFLSSYAIFVCLSFVSFRVLM